MIEGQDLTSAEEKVGRPAQVECSLTSCTLGSKDDLDTKVESGDYAVVSQGLPAI